MALNGTVQLGAWILNWATNEGQVRNDINVICCYIKKRLFEQVGIDKKWSFSQRLHEEL
jgi:hypothetical protein